MALGRHRRGIGVFAKKRDVEYALEELTDSGFPMEKVSTIVKESEGKNSSQGKIIDEKPGNEAGKGAAIGSVTGTTLGIGAGLLASLSTIAVPGVGPVLSGGTIISTIATTLAGGSIGGFSGGLIGALAGLGVPGDRAKVYSDRLSQGDYLLIVEGNRDEVMRAEMLLLDNPGLEEWGTYDARRDEPSILQNISKEGAQQ